MVDSHGNVTVARWNGRDPHGALFIADYRAHLITRFSDSLGDDPAPAPICCGAFTSTRCLPDPTCDGNCPGPSNCACSGNGAASFFPASCAEASVEVDALETVRAEVRPRSTAVVAEIAGPLTPLRIGFDVSNCGAASRRSAGNVI